MASLAERHCVACRGKTPALTEDQFAPLLAELEGWTVEDGRHLRKTYRLRDFRQAQELAHRIGWIAEEENHHPDLSLGWGRLEVTIWTHAAGGLTENDFVLAAKCDRAWKGLLADSR